MKPPRFLIGAALIFWGWHTDFLFVGTLMAVVLESTHFLKPRWEFGDEDFTRIWTFCSLLLLAGTVYAFTANDSASNLLSFLQDPNFFTQRRAGSSSAQSIASLMRWQPMIFFAFVAAGAFSAREGVPLRTVSLILQRRWNQARRLGQPPPPSPTVNVGYPFFGLCLFSASIQSNEGNLFFWGLCFLLGWALWPLRSRRYSFTAWAGAIGLALTVGYYGQLTLADLQQYIGNFNPQWFTKYSRRGFDPRQTKTMIGQVGEAKLSSRITIRLDALNNSKPPALLREASYRSFKGQVWYSDLSPAEFEAINHLQTNDTVWPLLEEEKAAHATVRIASYLPGGSGLLPLPKGTARLEELPAFIMQKNKLGAVHAVGPGLVIFKAFYGPGGTIDSPPERDDITEVPKRERATLEKVITELDLRGKPLPEVTAALNNFFQSKFEYSTWQGPVAMASTNGTHLGRFLTVTRSGHCEYFATATVLLLRQLGFPARYAVGYAVHERTGETSFVVRQRDAHAWSLVWNGARWTDLDTTPASWFAAEAKRASPFQQFSDFWSRIGFELSRIRWGQSHLRQYLLWALVPVLGLLSYQIVFRARRRRQNLSQESRSENLLRTGMDSEFFIFERRVSELGLVRDPAESMTAFVIRAVRHPVLLNSEGPIRDACRLHNRYRFDPQGLLEAERDDLRRISESSLRELGCEHSGLLERLRRKVRLKN